MKTAVRTLWFALMLGICAAHADPPAADDDGAAATGKSPASQPPSTGGTQQKQKPAGSFTPSEKVGADSAVSFPVDI